MRETAEWEGKTIYWLWPLGSLEGHSSSWTIYLCWDQVIFWALLDWAKVRPTHCMTASLALPRTWWRAVHRLAPVFPLSHSWLLNCWLRPSTPCSSLAFAAISNFAGVSSAENYTKLSSLLPSHDQPVAYHPRYQDTAAVFPAYLILSPLGGGSLSLEALFT